MLPFENAKLAQIADGRGESTGRRSPRPGSRDPIAPQHAHRTIVSTSLFLLLTPIYPGIPQAHGSLRCKVVESGSTNLIL